jgi:hypothetical protein
MGRQMTLIGLREVRVQGPAFVRPDGVRSSNDPEEEDEHGLQRDDLAGKPW